MNNYSWIFPAITAVVAIATIVYTSRKSIKESGKWEGSINSKIESLEKAVSEIRDDIRAIFGILAKRGSATTENSSPIRLTEMGGEIAAELNSRQWVEQVAPTILEDVKGKHPYEIQEFCFQYMRKALLSKEMDERIKECAYQRGITKTEVLEVFAIELRDELIEKLWR